MTGFSLFAIGDAQATQSLQMTKSDVTNSRLPWLLLVKKSEGRIGSHA